MENADTTLPKVSVILTTFNREYFFTEAIESILEQDYPNLEIIISDDGSSDNTFAFACEYAKDHPCIKVVQNTHSKGSAGNRNNGLDYASGDLVLLLDEPSIQIVIPKGFAPAILQTGTTQSLPGENGAVKEIMPAEEWNNITKEDINRGIVVVDHAITYDNGQTTGTVSDFNEYVWIPMPDSSKFARVAWNGPYLTDELKNGIHPLNEVSTENAYWQIKKR